MGILDILFCHFNKNKISKEVEFQEEIIQENDQDISVDTRYSNSFIDPNNFQEDIVIDSNYSLAKYLILFLGGEENIISIDNCTTRLKVEVKDLEIIQYSEIKKIVPGILKTGNTSVQVIIGPQVEFVVDEMLKMNNHLNKDKKNINYSLSEYLILFLGGEKNIISIDNCTTRLKVKVRDSSIVNDNEIKKLVPGNLNSGETNIQVIIGPQVEFIATEIKNYLKNNRY